MNEMISPFFTISPTFLFKTIPTLLSISSSFLILPAPSLQATFPISFASILVIYPSLLLYTGSIIDAFSNLSVFSK